MMISFQLVLLVSDALILGKLKIKMMQITVKWRHGQVYVAFVFQITKNIVLKKIIWQIYSLLNSKSTDIPKHWLTLSDIQCLFTVPYCKSTVLLLYRATLDLPHRIPLYRDTVFHWTGLYRTLTNTVTHCTYVFISYYV